MYLKKNSQLNRKALLASIAAASIIAVSASGRPRPEPRPATSDWSPTPAAAASLPYPWPELVLAACRHILVVSWFSHPCHRVRSVSQAATGNDWAATAVALPRCRGLHLEELRQQRQPTRYAHGPPHSLPFPAVRNRASKLNNFVSDLIQLQACV